MEHMLKETRWACTEIAIAPISLEGGRGERVAGNTVAYENRYSAALFVCSLFSVDGVSGEFYFVAWEKPCFVEEKGVNVSSCCYIM